MRIRPLANADLEEWLWLRRALWPDADPADLRSELGEYTGGRPDRGALVAEERGGHLCGFIELSLRNIVDGCASSPVGYIEGWYVKEAVRRQGIGRALIEAGESWARQKGCTEMGSDTQLENLDSQAAHRALGYEVTERLVAFRRQLS